MKNLITTLNFKFDFLKYILVVCKGTVGMFLATQQILMTIELFRNYGVIGHLGVEQFEPLTIQKC
jgi:hypothetical protein